MKPAILVLGNYCHDTLVNKQGEQHFALGGSAAYVAATLTGLGADFELIAKVGPDFRYTSEVLVPPRVVPEDTTAFVDDYRGDERVCLCTRACTPILPDEVPDRPFEVVVACGIAGEVGPRTLERARSSARILLADAQGLLRAVGPDGRVENRRLDDTPFAAAPIDYLKASRREAACLDVASLRRRATVIITDGPRGCVIVDARGETHVPCDPVEEVDSTGAGDCFLAGFTFAISRGWGPLEAARAGNLCGAAAVRVIGVPRFAAGQLVLARA